MAREVVVVTGASAGVGRAVARAFGKRSAHVALLARGEEGLNAAQREVEQFGGRALALPTDVADYEQVEEAARRTEAELGAIDVWVSNAMTTVFGEFTAITPDEYRRATEVTYLGAVWSARCALSRMLPRDRGSLVLVGSALAYRGIPLQAPYSGAKHAIKGMFESLRAELAHQGSNVRLSMVQLPALNTPQFEHCRVKAPVSRHPQPVPPIYEPEIAAEAIYWAAHHDRRQLYVGLPTVLTILGNKLAPSFGDWYLAKTGYESQQMPDTPLAEDRRDNLFAPVPFDEGAHGRFDRRAHRRSVQTWLAEHRGIAAAAAGGAAAGAALLRRR